MSDAASGTAREAAVRAAVAEVWPSVRRDLEELVRVPSVSGDPARSEDLARSAELVASLLHDAGLPQVRILPAAGGPAVLARREPAPGHPTVLLYAHHDVQPVGDPAAWSVEPFDPVERDGRLLGRGAADDKAGIAVHLAALRALPADSGVGLVVLVEGEEEIGSPGLDSFLDEHAAALRADVAVVADAAVWDVGRPALTTSLRGAVLCAVEVSTLEHPVHSGLWGGAVPDAATVGIRMLAALHDEHGDVAIPDLVRGSSAAVTYPPDRVLAEAGALPGVQLLGSGSVADRLWRRPSVTVTGLDATPTNQAGNALMARLGARLSLRLAPGEDAERAARALREYLERHLAWGARLELRVLEATAPMELATTGPGFAAMEAALCAAWDGAEPARVGVGGSIPFVAGYARRHPDAEIVVTGVEDPHTRAHGPDESVHLDVLRRACLAEALFLDLMDRAPRPLGN